MLRRSVGVAALLLGLSALASAGAPDNPSWPLNLRNGIPTALPGWDAAPRDPLPDTDENGMGVYTEVSRFFQKIEPSTARQFRIVVQDYGKGKDLEAAIRQAVAEAAKAPGVETREFKIAGLSAYAVTDHSQGLPTTLVTVVVTPGRLVLGQGSNVERDDAVKLLGRVDYVKVAAAR
ncbi:MAG TPA: hypothetical protein VMR54_03645 [Thermoanaerobaculia bacterium]|nr:hypothetical protein [Thermoanaerobaculia bacterium]